MPAPFGPSSAVMPGPIVKATSDTATTSPNHFETWSSSIMATSAAPTGPAPAPATGAGHGDAALIA